MTWWRETGVKEPRSLAILKRKFLKICRSSLSVYIFIYTFSTYKGVATARAVGARRGAARRVWRRGRAGAAQGSRARRGTRDSPACRARRDRLRGGTAAKVNNFVTPTKRASGGGGSWALAQRAGRGRRRAGEARGSAAGRRFSCACTHARGGSAPGCDPRRRRRDGRDASA